MNTPPRQGLQWSLCLFFFLPILAYTQPLEPTKAPATPPLQIEEAGPPRDHWFKRDQYMEYGGQSSGTFFCLGSPLFGIEIAPTFEKGVASTLELIPEATFIVGFTCKLPPFLKEKEGTRGLVFRGTPTEDIHEQMTPQEERAYQIHVVPIVDTSLHMDMPASCLDQYHIELPIVYDPRPELVTADHDVYIRISSLQTVQQFSVFDGTDTEETVYLDLFTDNEPEALEVSFERTSPYFEPNIQDGRLTFRHNGPIQPQKSSTTISLVAKDRLEQSSPTSTITFHFLADDDTKPKWHLQKDNLIDVPHVYREGDEVKIGHFGATNLVTNEWCRVSPVASTSYQYNINASEHYFSWKIPEHAVAERKKDSVVIHDIVFKATTTVGVEKKCTLRLRIQNATTEEAQLVFEEAIKRAEEASKSYLSRMYSPICFLKRAGKKLNMRNDGIQVATKMQKDIGIHVKKVPLAGPFLSKALSAIVGHFAAVNEKKRVRVKQGFEGLKDLSEQYEELYKNTTNTFPIYKNLNPSKPVRS